MAKISNVKTAAHGTTALTGLVEANYAQDAVIKESRSDGSATFTRDKVVGGVRGTLTFDDETGASAAAAIATSGALVIKARIPGGTEATYTFANAFMGGQSGNLPSMDVAGMARYSVSFVADSVAAT
jgi:hypothetical protein